MGKLGGRFGLIVALGGLIATPLLVPYLCLILDPSAFTVWREWDRISTLLGHTLGLISLTLLFVMPVGVATALLLQATNTRCQSVAKTLLIIGLATPLPITTVAWHLVQLGHWSPFAQGLLPAAILHALAGLPWVVLIVNAALSARDPMVDDDARLHAGPLVRAFRVTLPSVRGFVLLASLWVTAQSAGEIVVTDMLQVRTFAEEVYTQTVAPATESGTAAELAVARAVAASLPMPLILILAMLLVLPQLRGHAFQFMRSDERRSNRSWFAVVFVMIVAVSAVAIPLANLIVRCGASSGGWSVAHAFEMIAAAARQNAALLANSLIVATFVGMGVSVVAGIAAALCAQRRWVGAVMFLIAVLAATVPGPIIGLGVKAAIDELLTRAEKQGITWLRGPLYDGPSLLPVAWVWIIRAWPLALAVWWPAISRLPRDFGEATRMDSGSRLAMLRHNVLPALWRPFVAAAGLVTVYSLGEVSASRLVATPGGQSFAHDVFARMHYGITPELAGMCLVLLFAIIVVMLAASVMRPRAVP